MWHESHQFFSDSKTNKIRLKVSDVIAKSETAVELMMFEDKDEVQKAVMELKLFSGMASGEFATEEDILDSTGEVAAQVNYKINYLFQFVIEIFVPDIS